MADNGYDPRAQAMEEIHFDWRCIVCCMVALFPLHLEQQLLPGTESVYFDIDNTPWVKCDKCHTPFIYSVGSGNLFMLSDPFTDAYVMLILYALRTCLCSRSSSLQIASNQLSLLLKSCMSYCCPRRLLRCIFNYTFTK